MSNYANPAACYGVSILLSLLGVIVVTWRIVLRRKKYSSLSIDDWLCVPALTFTIGCALVIIIGTAKGSIGRHSNSQSVHDVMMENIAQESVMHQCSWAFNILAYIALGFIKLSFIFFYRRVFRGKIFNLISWSLILLISLWAVLFAMILIFMCGTHFSYGLGPLQQLEMNCLNVFDQNLAGSVLDVLFDIAILAIPIVMIWQLKLPMRNKIALLSIFLTAGLSIAAGIYRLVINIGLMSRNHLIMTTMFSVSSTDELGLSTIQLFWSMIEIGIAMIVVCMPALRLGTFLPTAYTALIKALSDNFLVRPNNVDSSTNSSLSATGQYQVFDEDHYESTYLKKYAVQNATPPEICEPYEVHGRSKSLTELDGKPKSIKELEGDEPGGLPELQTERDTGWRPCSSNWPLPNSSSIFIKPPPRGTSGRIVIAPPPPSNTSIPPKLPQPPQPCMLRRIIAPPRISSAPGPSRIGKPKSVRSDKSQKSIKELEGDFPPIPVARPSTAAGMARLSGAASESTARSIKSVKELEGDAPEADIDPDAALARSFMDMMGLRLTVEPAGVKGKGKNNEKDDFV